MRLKEKYPKNVSFYLEERNKNHFSLHFMFLDEQLNIQNGKNLSKNQKQKVDKNKYDNIKDKIKFRYFHPEFKKKADKIIKEDKDKEEFIFFIESIIGGKKEYYTQEKLRIINNFIYSKFTAKNQKLKLKVNFCIFFEKTPRVLPYSTYLQKIFFFDICKEKESSEKSINQLISEFEQNFKYKNCDLEFDKMIYLGEMKEKIFYEVRDMDDYNSNKEYYRTFPFEIRTKNEIFKKINLFDKEYLQGFEPSIWELKFPINSVLQKISEIDKFNYNAFFEKDVLEFHPSKMETKLINMNDNFILSGRPGTGKTVIILIKIIMCFLRCLYEHSNIIRGKVDFDYINNTILENIFNSDIDKINKDEENSEENQVDKFMNKNKLIDNIISNTINDKIENKEKNEDEENSENTIITKTVENLGTEGGTYKIIFTSLSQSLCAFAENSFVSGLKRNSAITCNISPTNQKTYERMSSFVHQQKYPLFLNFRKLIFMIDGSLNYQFFDRPNKNKLRKRQDDCDIRYYPDCQYDVMVDLSFLVYRPGNIYFYRRKYLENPLEMTEINEDSFYNNFNAEIQNNKTLNNDKSHISTYEVYSNIISIIKGSVKSYLVGAISLDDYLSTGKKVCPFDFEQKKEIYNIFEKYEMWKLKNNYFDFQDVVNYLIREVNIELVPQNRKMFDLVFIDEVQDFSINQLYLLFLISRDIKVLAGDTCQTLSKINTFRFADLNNVLYTFASIKNIKINEQRNIEINLNYRCQSNILKFAHLIYEMIRTFFSHTLDKVRMDFSTKVGGGEKPYLIPPEIKICESKKLNYKNLELVENKTGFDYFLKGLTENNLFLDDPKSIINISFSVNHCVICRNNDVVKKLNTKYNNKIFCSTAFESKGLEYEIVILYNFFKDSLPFIKEIWSYVLKNINVKQTENNYLYLIKENLEFEGFPSSIKDQIYSIFNKKFLIELSNEFKNQFSIYNFCSELKELYVAITRAKNRLYIYEEDKDLLRLFMTKIVNYDIISQDVYNIKMDKDDKDKFKLILNQEDNYSLLNKKVIGCIKFINNSSLTKEKLLKTAYDEYNQDNEYNFKKALYLFQVLNEEIMKTKCLINLKFIEMQKLKGADNQSIKTQFISLNSEIMELIEKIKYDDYKQIKGEVLINLERYDEALEYFKNKNNYKKCGIVLIKKKEYENALKYFIQGKEYSFAVNCLIELKNYSRLYDFLLEYSDEFDLEHIQYFYKITCDKFFQKYALPKQDNKKGYKIKKTKKEENLDKKEQKYEIEIKCDSYNLTKDEKFLDDKNNLYDLIPNEKIKIKNKAFILTSSPNSSIFDIEENISNKSNNIYTIKKTREEIIYLINTFKALLNFILVYLQIIIGKTEKNKNRELFIKESKNMLLNIEKEISKENISNEELIELMEKLFIRKHEFKVIITGVLKNIEAKEFIYDLYEINIFKVNIIEHIQKDIPITNKNINDKNVDKDLLSSELVKQLVSYSKYLPIKEDDIIYYLKYCFIRCYNLNALFGLMKNNDIKGLLDLCVLNKKQKLFEFLLKTLDVDFINGKIKNDLFKNIKLDKYEIIHYLNAYVNMLIYKFFKYYFNEKSESSKLDIVLQKIKIFPQLYEILYLISKEKDKIINLSSLIDFINEINCDDIINFQKGNISMEKYIKLISIVNKINLILTIITNKKMLIKFKFSDNINENSKIFDVLMKNKAKILDIYNILKEDFNKNHKNDKFYTHINAVMLDKKEMVHVNDNIEYENGLNYYINYCFLKIEYLQQNDKNSIDLLNKKNNITFNSYIFIYELKKVNYFLLKSLFKYIDEHKQIEKNINPKYLHILTGDTLLNIFDSKQNMDKIMLFLNQFYYLGERPLNKDEFDNYNSQSKIIFERFIDRNYLDKERVDGPTVIDTLVYKILSKENKKSNLNETVNFILFSNIIGGGFVKFDYKNILYKYRDSFHNIKNVENVYLKKDFSYFDALKSIVDNYNSNLNQLLVIIWFRKIFNIFYIVLSEDKNEKSKLFIDKNKNDIELNTFEIKQYLAKQKDFNKYNFIDKYLSALSAFIKNMKNYKDENKEILSEIKKYFSEIYYSLEDSHALVETKIKNKIKFALDEMKNSSDLLINNKEMFKEVILMNDENISKNVTYILIGEVYLSYFKNIEGEDYDENNSEDDYYSDDYDEIEDNIMKNKNKGKEYYY